MAADPKNRKKPSQRSDILQVSLQQVSLQQVNLQAGSGSESTTTPVSVRPLTPNRLSDLEGLFGPRGACGGCWCMTPRLTLREYERDKGEVNRQSMRSLVRDGAEVGVLGYRGRSRKPIAWCAIAPRADYSSLARSRILKPVDDQPVWSIVCLFVSKDERRTGVSGEMIRGAAEHAFRCGAEIVEGYPVEPKSDPMPPVFAYTGIAAAYRTAGFEEVARRSESRPIMRLKRP